ncbi:FRG domain-containing protein [Spirosoma sp.]|uniref:FRG domain-containing protein n=1 Tax=Spirosoma sp. TaxID=1899569 RepID=UPI0026027046|nr:FRG domain-containing protein [Spirosoma sp.]MCX6218437.1 FRG domain-containing protein [Spirosoma sp.]
MIKGQEIANLLEFFTLIDRKQAERERNNAERILYRGQLDCNPLLPSIARNRTSNTRSLEGEMLSYIERVAHLKIDYDSQLDLLITAQHYGLKTRLLDWTSNPLAALYFAIEKEYGIDKDSYVYIFEVPKETILSDRDSNSPLDAVKKDPFSIKRTSVLRPTLNNDRIVAQSGWFTIHCFDNGFIPLEEEPLMKNHLTEIKIPKSLKRKFMAQINDYGINARTMFPDFEGTCKHANWKFQ